MEFTPYLGFNGNCEAAFQFYEKCFNGKIEAMIPHTGTPAENSVPPEWREKIMHARLNAGDHLLMGGDVPPGHYKGPSGFSIMVQPKSVEEAERLYNALSENGKAQMPLQQTFFAARYGMLTDQFGIPWMIYVEGPRPQS